MFDLTLDGARQLDRDDALARFRGEFHVPTRADGREEIYLCGNSLGLQPKAARMHVLQELDAWQTLGVEGHFKEEAPWYRYHELFRGSMSRLVASSPQRSSRATMRSKVSAAGTPSTASCASRRRRAITVR